MLGAVLAFCGGAVIVQLLPALPAAPLSAGAAATAVACAWRGWFAPAALCAGLALAAAGAARLLAGDWPCERDREVLVLTGTVAATPVPRAGRVDFDFAPEPSTVLPHPPPRIRLSWYDAEALPQPGQRWRLGARLRCRVGYANPGGHDRELDLLRQRVLATGYLTTDPPPDLLEPATGGRHVERLRARVAGAIAERLPGSDSGAVLQGLSVGARSQVRDELWEAFAATGLAHLMAISGMHVTGFAVFVLWLMRGVARLPAIALAARRPDAELLLLVAATAAYAALAGASLPALRTLAMVSVVALQRALRRSQPVALALALAAAALVALDPLAVASAGFWLSFVATAALLCLLDAGPGWGDRLRAFARAQAAVLLLLAPVLAGAFGRLSLLAPFANALAIPVFGLLLLPATLAGTAFELLGLPFSGAWWGWLAGLMDGWWPALVAAGRWPLASWAPAAQPLPLLAAVAAACATCLLLPVAGLRLLAIVSVLALALGRSAAPGAGGVTLAVLDVGQGLAAVVRTQRQVLLFDTGPRWRGGPPAATVTVLPYLRSLGIRRVDLLVASHDDADHAGGVEAIRRALPVQRLLAAPGSALAGAAPCERGQSWQWDGVAFEVLHPPPGFAGSDNDSSCALRVSAPGGRLLLLADPERRAERLLAALEPDADVVLLPHHGSRSSSGEALVAATGARLAIASAGAGNRWGLPDPGVVARWRAAGTTVLVTSSTGAVEVEVPPVGPLRVRSQRAAEPRWWRARRGAAAT